MRIDVVGLPGSGKTTFAEGVSKKLAIPHIHLDRFWFESGGRQGRRTTPNLEEVRAKVRERAIDALRADAWVSDGTYLHIQDLIAPRADVIVFLDIPLWTRLRNHFHRTFIKRKSHQEVTLWDDITFFTELIRRQILNGPKLRQFIARHGDKVVTLRSRNEIDAYLQSLVPGGER
jgi:adenylate kinase family enzyme